MENDAETDYYGTKTEDPYDYYNLTDLLAEGSYGAVYRAIHIEQNQLYVIFQLTIHL